MASLASGYTLMYISSSITIAFTGALMVERERERDAELRKGRSELRYVSITEGEKGRPTLKMLVYTLHPSLSLSPLVV